MVTEPFIKTKRKWKHANSFIVGHMCSILRKGYLLRGQNMEVIWYNTDLTKYKEEFSKNWAAHMGNKLGKC